MRDLADFFHSFTHKISTLSLGVCLIVLTACGGGGVAAILATLQYVPAIGGDFCLDSDGDGIDTVNNNCVISVNIAIESAGGTTWEAFYDTRLGIFGKTFDDPVDTTPNPFSCTDFIGFVDDGVVTAYQNDSDIIQTTDEIDPATRDICFSGTLVNLNLLRLDSGEELLFDEADNLALTEGVWSNIDDAEHFFKFTNVVQATGDFTGCEIDVGVKTDFLGSYQPSDIKTRVFADFEELRIQSTPEDVWEGDFFGLSAITLTQPNGAEIRLQRVADDNNTYTCN